MLSLSVVVFFVDFAGNEAVDHELFLHRVRVNFGIRGKALVWFTSYLDVGADSSTCSVMHGVPEGSSLSTWAASITSVCFPNRGILRKHGMIFLC